MRKQENPLNLYEVKFFDRSNPVNRWSISKNWILQNNRDNVEWIKRIK